METGMSFQSSEAISTSSCAEVRTLVPLKPWDEKTAALHACLKLIQNNPYSKKKFTWPFSKKIQATWSFIRPNLEAFWPVDPRRPPAKGWILHIYIYRYMDRYGFTTLHSSFLPSTPVVGWMHCFSQAGPLRLLYIKLWLRLLRSEFLS